MNKKLVIFDFDGTIVDTADLLFEIGKLFYPNLTKTKFQTLFEGNTITTFAKIFSIDLAVHALKLDKHELFVEYQRRLKKKHLHTGMQSALKTLSKDYTLAVASNTPARIIKPYLKKHSITVFKKVLGSDTHYNKSDNIEELLENYNVDPKNAILITDTLGDMKQARKAGIRSIGVTWGVHGMRRLRKGRPVAIVKSPQEIATKIRKML